MKAGPQTFTLDLPKANASLRTYLSEPLALEYYPAEDPRVKCLLYWQPLALPVLKDQKVAELRLISAKGEVLKQVPLLAVEEVRLAWPYNWLAVLPVPHWLFIVAGGLLGALVLVFVWKYSRLFPLLETNTK